MEGLISLQAVFLSADGTLYLKSDTQVHDELRDNAVPFSMTVKKEIILVLKENFFMNLPVLRDEQISQGYLKVHEAKIGKA